ncbi:MAG: hypothetical protein KGL39_23795 [Patescibacteria group bacterium]|nr:hypothetical protein [Patescibacteria group bacterium]
MAFHTWPDGTPKSCGNAFDWRGEPSIFFNDPYFRAVRNTGYSMWHMASIAREMSELAGHEVSTVTGIGRIVVDQTRVKALHVHRPARRKA